MSPRATIPAPIEIAKFFKTRWRNESVHVSLREYEGNCLIDIRVFRTGTNGIDYATTKGLTMSIRKLEELQKAITKALKEARALNLLPNDHDGGGE